MKILVTGGAGFIGSAVVRHLLMTSPHSVINVDNLTYAGNLSSLAEVHALDNHTFCQINICNKAKLRQIFDNYRPEGVIHLAAESHVDRSIDEPGQFIQTNLVGTYTLLEESRRYWCQLSSPEKDKFRLVHVSTDEVYGDLDDSADPADENYPYLPSSPYSASKAGSDHLVRAWQRTFQLPTIITNCSNNYGPYQFPEKLIPHIIISALHGQKLPVYGNGLQVRDWLYVEDHARALLEVFLRGKPGETYNIGGGNEKHNIDVVREICALLEDYAADNPYSRRSGNPTGFEGLIQFVSDRPGHDARYAINAGKIERELGWHPIETFTTGIDKTVNWYLHHQDWWQSVLNGSYRLDRLGKL